MAHRPGNLLGYGGELWKNRFRITRATVFSAAGYIFLVQIALWIVIQIVWHHEHYGDLCESIFGVSGHRDYSKGFGLLASVKGLIWIGREFMQGCKDGVRIFWITSPVWFSLPFILFYWKNYGEVNLKGEEYLRGREIKTAQEVKQQILEVTKDTNIEFRVATKVPDGAKYTVEQAVSWPSMTFPVPREAENKGWWIQGKPGSGKTQAILQIIEPDLKQGIPMVFSDLHGDFILRLFKKERGDINLNFYDDRFCGWNLFNDIRQPTDLDAFTGSLYPPAQGSQDPFFPCAAAFVTRGLLKSIIYKEPEPRNEKIFEILAGGPIELKAYCLEVDPIMCNNYLADPTDKMAQSVMATVLNGLYPFERLKSGPFSITDWVERRDGSLIFAVNPADKRASLTPVLTTFFELLGQKLLSQDAATAKRTWVIMDEVFALNKLTIIQTLPTEGRKFQIGLVLAAQDRSKGEMIYTEAGVESMVSALGNVLFYAVKSPRTAAYISDTLAEVETRQHKLTESGGIQDNRDGYGGSEDEKEKKAVLKSTIMSLGVFECYVQIDGFDFWRGYILPKDYDTDGVVFIEAAGVNEFKRRPPTAPVAVSDPESDEPKDLAQVQPQAPAASPVHPTAQENTAAEHGDVQDVMNMINDSTPATKQGHGI